MKVVDYVVHAASVTENHLPWGRVVAQFRVPPSSDDLIAAVSNLETRYGAQVSITQSDDSVYALVSVGVPADLGLTLRRVGEIFRREGANVGLSPVSDWGLDSRAVQLWEPELGQLLGHPMNDVSLGVFDPQTQGLVPVGFRKDFGVSQRFSLELLQAGRVGDAGFVVFEGQPDSSVRADWLKRILGACLMVCPDDEDIIGAQSLCSDSSRWSESYSEFRKLRQRVLAAEPGRVSRTLLVAELCMKVLHNMSLSGEFAPFDRDSGWSIVAAVQSLGETYLTEDVWISALYPDIAIK